MIKRLLSLLFGPLWFTPPGLRIDLTTEQRVLLASRFYQMYTLPGRFVDICLEQSGRRRLMSLTELQEEMDLADVPDFVDELTPAMREHLNHCPSLRGCRSIPFPIPNHLVGSLAN